MVLSLRRLDLELDPEPGLTLSVALFRPRLDDPATRAWVGGDWCAALPRGSEWAAEAAMIAVLGQLGLAPERPPAGTNSAAISSIIASNPVALREARRLAPPFSGSGRLAQRTDPAVDPSKPPLRDPSASDITLRYLSAPWVASLGSDLAAHRIITLLASPDVIALETEQARHRPASCWFRAILP